MSTAGQRPDPSRYQVIPRTLVFGLRLGRVLLQQVAQGRGEWAGLWNGLGGHVEPGESPAQAAVREFHEETGLALIAPRLAGTLVVDLAAGLGLVLFVFVGQAGPGEERANHEGALGWFAPEEVGSLPAVSDLAVLLPRALTASGGAPPFSGRSFYGASGELITQLDPPPA
jgi:8-oxo-dGTP diphosphatase